MSVRVIAGLGNPGTRYDQTRHNVGFDLLNAFAKTCGGTWQDEARFRAHTAVVPIAGQSYLLVKPQTYMNESGWSLGEICRWRKLQPSDFLVIYDEYQIPVGQAKLSVKGGAGGHNGIADILQRLGGSFIRYRIGIGPAEKPLVPLKDFVLGHFTEGERAELERQFPRFLADLQLLLRAGVERAMNQINQRPSQPKHERQDPPPIPGDGDSGHPRL